MPKLFPMLAMLLCCPLGLSSQTPIASDPVTTASGQLAGQIDTRSEVAAFKGIPYAAPPVGDLRWRPPVPPAPWTGIREATHFGDSCIQRTHGPFLPWTEEFLVQNKVSEDCLFLNLWTPRAGPKDPLPVALPVVVFIHGGAFTEGSGAIQVYDGQNLAATGLVVVTINYRLGALGFLALPELTAESPQHTSGNYGLMDQIAALQWVQTNISAFGGDPHNVTLWGQSAGAFSVGALLASPQAKDLFQRAVADSGLGSTFVHQLSPSEAQENGLKFAASHHVKTLKELRALPAEDLILGPQDRSTPFGPILDGFVLPDTPAALSQKHEDSDVPVITGYQANDWLLGGPPLHTPAEFDTAANHLYGSLAGDFERLYPGSTAQEMQRSIAESSRDRDRVSMYLWAQQRVANHTSPVFTYFFDRAIPWPQHPEFQAFHTGEIPYFFRNLWVLDRRWEAADIEVSHVASSYLRAFAATGDPNQPGLPAWPRVTAGSPTTMEIGITTRPMPLADKAKYDFWVRYFQSPESKNAPLF